MVPSLGMEHGTEPRSGVCNCLSSYKSFTTEADPEGGVGGSSPGQILNPLFSNN